MHQRLRKQQGTFKRKPVLPILDELIATVLSQHTSDINTERAFSSLKATFPTWDEVPKAPIPKILAAIRSGGLAQQKAPRIKAIVNEVIDREGKADLSRMHELTDQEVEDYLTSLPGVGPKTAACVLTFAMGRAAFPVDVHVHRVVQRLGWIDEKASADKVHRELGPRIPPDIRYELHVQFINHGRTVCLARNPLCSDCLLFDLCPAGPQLLAMVHPIGHPSTLPSDLPAGA